MSECEINEKNKNFIENFIKNTYLKDTLYTEVSFLDIIAVYKCYTKHKNLNLNLNLNTKDDKLFLYYKVLVRVVIDKTKDEEFPEEELYTEYLDLKFNNSCNLVKCYYVKKHKCKFAFFGSMMQISKMSQMIKTGEICVCEKEEVVYLIDFSQRPEIFEFIMKSNML